MRSPATVLALLLIGAAAAWAGAKSAEGGTSAEARAVEGTVRSARVDGNTVTLAFDDDPTSLRIILLRGWLDDFPRDPAHYYLGKTVQVHGSITRFRGVPEMLVRDVDDVVVVGQSQATGPVETSSPDEVKALRERLQRLEERVRELERHEVERKSGSR